MDTLLIPESAKRQIDRYFNLQLGGKSVKAPYFINKKKLRAGLRVLIGKGSPEEIEREVKVWAQFKGVDLSRLSPEQIREFMLLQNIGIECSGFVTHVLNAMLTASGKGKLTKYIKFPDNSLTARIRRTLRPVENIGADVLTGPLNCVPVAINDVLPGDLIRSTGKERNAHHVMLVTGVTKDSDNVKEIEYSHSTREYGSNNGVRVGKIKITNPDKPLEDQDWQEIENDRCYTLEGFQKNASDNGLRRIKNLGTIQL